jgi:hypothetical protein
LDANQRELIVWSDVPAVPLASASAGGGFLSPFLDSDLITFCRVHGTGAREKKSQLWKQRKRIWRVPPRPAGRGRPETRTRQRVFSPTYGCPRRRGGRARRAGVAGQRRQRAYVEGDEPAGGGGGRVGAEARLPSVSSRRDNLQVREKPEMEVPVSAAFSVFFFSNTQERCVSLH